jgi:hypothetical protein
MRAESSEKAKGFWTKSSAPLPSARMRSATLAQPARTKTGSAWVRLRRNRKIEMPSFTGKSRSIVVFAILGQGSQASI